MPIIADSSQGTTQPIVPIPTKTTTVPTNTVQAIPEASNAINTNQFNFWANIGKIPWVNDKTMAQNPIFQTKEFKEKESLTIEWIKDPIFWESIKNIKSWPYSIDEQVRLIWLAKLQKSKRDSAMSLVWLVGDLLNPSEPIPDDQVDAVYSDLTPEVRNAARWFAADMLNWMPLDEWRKLYPELGKSFFFNKVQDIPYVNQINLDNIKQDISNRTPSDMIPFVEPTFQWNAKDLERTWFLWWFQEVAKFVGNIPSTILNAAIFGTNLMINPESTGKRVWLLPKSLDLSIRQARADTEWLSMPYRMQHLVNNVADFVTENPDIVAWFELWWLIKKWAIRWIWTLIDSIPRPIQDVIMDELKADGILEPTVSQFEAKAQEIYDRQFKKNAETSVDVNVEDGITYTNNRWEVVPAPIINTSQKINDMVFQSLSPTQRWARVKNVRDIQKFAEKMTKWISAVFLNRDNLPDLFESWMLKKDYSMVDLWQAMEDTGDDVWDTAQWMLDEAELQGTKIPTNLIVNYIDQSIADLTRNWGKVIPWFEWVIKYLNDLKNYVWWDDISIYDAQILSKKLNKLTYWWSQSDNLNKRVAEDVNQILRPSIDNELSNMLGQKWLSNFKAIFWAVRELNELVTKLALKDAKQLPMSFWDRVSQWFTANEMMNAWFSIARWDFVWATMSASKAFMAKVVSNFVKADKDRGLILRKLFNEINSQVWDVKIAWWYWTHLVRKMWAVEEMIRWAKKDKSVKLDYTPEATPMMTPEWTINQTIVTAPEKKWWYMQTDITKPWAIKEPLGLDTREAFKKQFDISISNTPIEKFPDANKLRPAPNSELQKKTNEYTKENLNKTISNWFYLDVQENVAKKIADIYDSLPIDDSKNPKVIKSYTALVDEIDKQWDYATNELWIKFIPREWEWQPYANSTEMVNDVSKNKRLFFFTWWEPHPFLDKIDPKTWLSWNEKFRAIHDLFWHATEWFSFSAKWEENAWIKHAQMFSDEARQAMTTETRWQNSRVNYWKQNYDANWDYKNIPPSERPYATQKVALLPDKYSNIWKVVSEKVWYKDILKELNNEWWLSYDILKQGFVKNKPFVAVSPYVNRSKTLDTVIKWSDIKKYIQDNEDIIFREWHVLWIWKDEWKTYIDVTILLPKSKLKQAKAIGQALNQKAIYDLSPNIVDKKRTINTLWDGKDIWISDTDVDMIIQNILSNKKW